MLIGLAKYYFGFSINNEQLPSRFIVFALFILIYWPFSKYFESKSNKICEKYEKKYSKKSCELYSIKNLVIVISLYVLPLLIGIYFNNLSIE